MEKAKVILLALIVIILFLTYYNRPKFRIIRHNGMAFIFDTNSGKINNYLDKEVLNYIKNNKLKFD